MPANNKQGVLTEKLAFNFLQKKGLKLIEKNYYTRFGEIDLIMQDSDMIAFIEVRYRKNSHFGSGAETVTTIKQSKIIRTASVFLQQHAKLSRYPARFDVVSISGETSQPKIDWIKNAFDS